MRIIILTLLITTLISCKNISESNSGKTRTERLREIPYREEVIDTRIRNSILKNISMVLERLESLEKTSIFYVTTQGTIKQLDGDWKNGKEAIKEADGFTLPFHPNAHKLW